MVQVKVNEGILEGVEVDNEYGGKIFKFKGIPYAEPPVGDLRFKAPRPIKPWQGVRSAKEHGPCCFQQDLMFDKHTETRGSEDCLYLNVYSPNLNPNKPLPVMFWIHGGGFFSGNGNDDNYGPDYLVRHDVILVTINYRLDILGYLCLDSEDVPGNAGMKDQVAALRWVKNNISYFGGDPENITIFGESAGGSSVTLHLVSPMTKGLFKRAIYQSGAGTCHWVVGLERREKAKALARSLGLDSDNNEEILKFLQSQPVDKLINAKAPITLHEEVNENVRVNFGPCSEKVFGDNEVFFSGDIYDALRNGVHAGVEIMGGICKDEGYMVCGVGLDLDRLISQFGSYLELFAPREIAWNCSLKTTFEVGRKMKQFYTKGEKLSRETLNNIMDFLSMDIFSYGIIQWTKASSATNKTYFYKFTCQSKLNVMAEMMGMADLCFGKVVHADELSYIFSLNMPNIPKADKDSDEFKLINNMTTLWTNFAKIGNPTPDSSLGVQWQPFTPMEQNYLELGNQLMASKKPDEEILNFWESIFRDYYPHCLAIK
ncbi:carboxylesterase family domain-containing protein [Phthorimaea operculella]|nr:carboxylesterase family domain-containing protein [Phthorimaea operculella]